MADGHDGSEQGAEAYAVFDHSGQVVLASSSYARLMLATPEKLLGISIDEILGPSLRGEDVASRIRQAMNRVLISAHDEALSWVRFPFEIERVFRVELHPLIGSHGEAEALLQVVIEVSSRLEFGALFGVRSRSGNHRAPHVARGRSGAGRAPLRGRGVDPNLRRAHALRR